MTELLKQTETERRKTEGRRTDHTLRLAHSDFQNFVLSRSSWSRDEGEDDEPITGKEKTATDNTKRPPGRRWTVAMELGSRVDAPQKPNCRSPVQGLERQRLRRHLPSRSSVRAKLRDEDSYFATELWSVCSLLLCLWLERRGGEGTPLLAAEETDIWRVFTRSWNSLN